MIAFAKSFSPVLGKRNVSYAKGTICLSSASNDHVSISRRCLLSSAGAATLLGLISIPFPRHADASVDIDLDRFGDKGL